MLVRCHHDPREYFDLVGPFLYARESENALPLGIARSFVDSATHDGLMFSVESGANVVAVAVKSPKRSVVITRGPETAMRALAQYLYAYAFPVPGINGPCDAVQEFSRAWVALTGQTANERMRLRLYELTQCETCEPPSGAFRVAADDDADLVERWLRAFIDEATHDGHDHVRERVAQMIGAANVGLWENGGPVSMAAVTRRSHHGAHIAWVYTPKDQRGNGYATACVGELSRRELAAGRAFCTLYTDLSNQTSNSIYGRIGYKPVVDALDVQFH
jgi:uncharacterized protein